MLCNSLQQCNLTIKDLVSSSYRRMDNVESVVDNRTETEDEFVQRMLHKQSNGQIDKNKEILKIMTNSQSSGGEGFSRRRKSSAQKTLSQLASESHLRTVLDLKSEPSNDIQLLLGSPLASDSGSLANPEVTSSHDTASKMPKVKSIPFDQYYPHTSIRS